MRRYRVWLTSRLRTVRASAYNTIGDPILKRVLGHATLFAKTRLLRPLDCQGIAKGHTNFHSSRSMSRGPARINMGRQCHCNGCMSNRTRRLLMQSPKMYSVVSRIFHPQHSYPTGTTSALISDKIYGTCTLWPIISCIEAFDGYRAIVRQLIRWDSNGGIRHAGSQQSCHLLHCHVCESAVESGCP